MNVFDVRALRVKYGDFEAVKGVDFSVAKGEIFGIVGESGSGKSTIAKTLIGLEKAAGGEIVRVPDVVVQMIFQDAVGSLNPRMTVAQTLREAARHARGGSRGKGQGPSGEGIGKREEVRGDDGGKQGCGVMEPEWLLTLVGLSPAVMTQYPREMSGGQCQRVSIARALAAGGDVLIADEPVSALDVSVQARVLNLLRELRRELGLTIILIAHDLAVVKNVCDRVAVMEKGRFVDFGDASDVFEHPRSDYTRRLISAVPDVARSLARKEVIGNREEGRGKNVANVKMLPM